MCSRDKLVLAILFNLSTAIAVEKSECLFNLQVRGRF